MSDIADQAQDLEDRLRTAAISHARGTVDEIGTEFCESCGDEIEPERRAAMPSATRCVKCQGALEKHKKLYAGA